MLRSTTLSDCFRCSDMAWIFGSSGICSPHRRRWWRMSSHPRHCVRVRCPSTLQHHHPLRTTPSASIRSTDFAAPMASRVWNGPISQANPTAWLVDVDDIIANFGYYLNDQCIQSRPKLIGLHSSPQTNALQLAVEPAFFAAPTEGNVILRCRIPSVQIEG